MGVQSGPGPSHTAAHTHLAQELEKLEEDLGESGAGTGLVADLCEQDESADKWQRLRAAEWLLLHVSPPSLPPNLS